MNSIKINKHLNLVIEASIEAGLEIMKVYEKTFDVETKKDNSPVTEADKKANDIINRHLVPTNIPIISEENKQTNFSVRKNWDKCWIVDPLDGTKEFIKRNGEFTVNIALAEKGKPVLGVIYVPVSKTLYYADVHMGKAFKVNIEDENFAIDSILSKAVSLPEKKEDSNKIRVVGSRSHMNQETTDYVEKLRKEHKNIEIVSKGSSLKFCLVAEGKAEVYPRFAPTMEWDTAAGQAICNALGIRVISKDTNEDLLYNKENLLNPWFTVSNV